MVKVDQRIGEPQLLLQLLTGDNLAGLLQQCREDFKGPIRKLDAKAVFAQFASIEVDFEVTKAQLRWPIAAVTISTRTAPVSTVYHTE